MHSEMRMHGSEGSGAENCGGGGARTTFDTYGLLSVSGPGENKIRAGLDKLSWRGRVDVPRMAVAETSEWRQGGLRVAAVTWWYHLCCYWGGVLWEQSSVFRGIWGRARWPRAVTHGATLQGRPQSLGFARVLLAMGPSDLAGNPRGGRSSGVERWA